MSRISQIPEVYEMSPDTVIECIKGTLKKLYPRKSGQGENGEWSFQGGILEDSAGNTVELTWKGCPAVDPQLERKPIVILAYHGDKGWSGVYAIDNDYNGTVTRKIKITPTAEITVMEGGNQQRQPQSQPTAQTPRATGSPQRQAQPTNRSNPAPAPARPAASQQARTSPQSGDATATAKAFVSRKASGLRICLKAAHFMAEEFAAVTGQQMTADQVQAITSTLFITGDRAFMFDQLPVDLEYATLKPRPKMGQPAPARQAPARQAPAPAPEADPVTEGDAVPDGYDPEVGF